MVKNIILYDDETGAGRARASRGLSIYIEFNDTYLLFDLGSNGEILHYNAEQLGVDIDMVDAVVISHNHYNHVGGLPYIGWVSPYLKIYIPYDSISTLGKTARSNGLNPIEVSDWIMPWENIYISKPIHGPPWEHFLVIVDDDKLHIYSGCMHPGVSKTLNTIREYFDKHRIYSVIGGFHLENAPHNVVENTVDSLVNKYGVEKIIPLHCSGKLFKEALKNRYPDKFIEAGAGSVIQI